MVSAYMSHAPASHLHDYRTQSYQASALIADILYN